MSTQTGIFCCSRPAAAVSHCQTRNRGHVLASKAIRSFGSKSEKAFLGLQVKIKLHQNNRRNRTSGIREIIRAGSETDILSETPDSPDDVETDPADLKMVLVNPQIPGNTGTIARTCAATGVPLHLVAPLGFSIDDAAVKRAGLDYWQFVFVKCHDSWDDFFEYFKKQEGPKRLVGFSKAGARVHTEKGAYRKGDWLLMGSEIDGLPPGAWEQCRSDEYGGGLRRIPMIETHVRSLNLSVSAGIGVYEALRQVHESEE